MTAYLPCYAERISTSEYCTTQKQMVKYLEKNKARINRSGNNHNTGIVVISVTQEDHNWKLWIQALQEMPQVTFTRTRTKHHEGGYWCFLACFPCHPED